jgi:hypothetical protein
MLVWSFEPDEQLGPPFIHHETDRVVVQTIMSEDGADRVRIASAAFSPLEDQGNLQHQDGLHYLLLLRLAELSRALTTV